MTAWARASSGQRPPSGSDERGSSTLWSALVMALVLASASVVLAVGAVVAERHRAGVAADFAALAAAQVLIDGSGPPCVAASAVAAANGGRLSSCTAADGTVEVVVVARRRAGWWVLPPARGRARAGPNGAVQP